MAEIDMQELQKIRLEFKKRGIPFVERHTHTFNKYTKSFDIGKEPIEGPSLQVVDFVSKAGFEEVAITDHSYEILLYPQMEERTEIQLRYGDKAFDKYLSYLNEVKQKYPSIKVLGGIELKFRTMEDLSSIKSNQFKGLDLILIETPLKKPDFSEVRRKLGENMVIVLAHPDPHYNFGDSPPVGEMEEWIDEMNKNRIYFELSRQFVDKYLSNVPIYKRFFEMANQKGLSFSIGSDYHLKTQNYVKYLTKMLDIIGRYNFKSDRFLKF